MKSHFPKTVLAALGLAPCMALAQSSVTISGLLDLWAGSERSTSAAGLRSSASQLGRNGLTTSYWSISGNEDLGGGLSALFTLDSYIQPDTGIISQTPTSGYFSRSAFVGLRHTQWGTLVFGRAGTPLIGAMLSSNAFLTSTVFGSSYVNHWSGIIVGETSLNNSMRYVSPLWGGRWRVSALASLGEERPKGPDRNFGQALEARVEYVHSPAYATVAYRSHKLSNNEDGKKQDIVLAAASWDFGVLKTYAQYIVIDDSYRNRAQNVDRKGYTLGARVPLGSNGVFMLSHARLSMDDMDAATPARKRTSSLGYAHTLSKRTDVYLNWLDSRHKTPQGSQLRRMGLGLRHSF